MNKIKVFIILFFGVIIIFITIGNIIKFSGQKTTTKSIKILNRNYSSLLSKKYNGSIIKNMIVFNVIDNEEVLLNLSKKSIVIFLSNTACNPCQLSELKNLTAVKNKEISIFVIVLDDYNRLETLKLKKVSKSKFNFYYAKKSFFPEIDKFPVIFYIQRNIIASSLFAITGDPEYSINFYIGLKNLFNVSLP